MSDNQTSGLILKGLGRRLHILRLATTFLCLLLFAKLVEKNVIFRRFDDRHANNIQKIFTDKERLLMASINKLKECAEEVNSGACFIYFHDNYANNLKKRGLYVFIYRNDTLHYWSSNDVAVPEFYSSSEFNKPYVSLGNNSYASGKYASFVKKNDEYTVVGLALIKNVFVFENKYLKNAFPKDFGLPANVKVFPEHVAGSYPITDSDGQFMWSLIFDSTCFYDFQIYVPVVSYLLAIIILFLLFDSICSSIVRKNIYLSVLALILAAVRIAMQRWQIPDVFYQLGIFTPMYFGSTWFPSLGELCLWCVFICFFVFELYRFLEFPEAYKNKWKYFATVGISLLISILGFFAISALLKELVINSSGIFEGWHNSGVLFNQYDLLGHTIIVLFLASFCLLLDKAVQLCKQNLNFQQFMISYIIVLSLVIIVFGVFKLKISLITIFFLSVLVLFLGFMRLKRNVKFKYSHYILLVFILALFTSMYVNRHSQTKFENKKKLLVTNLASQHDFTTEFLLWDISERIIIDTVILADVVHNDFSISSDYQNVLKYIQRQYFSSSYWNRYRFRCWVCNDMSELFLTGQQRTINCVAYFQALTESMGEKLPRSEFWYIDRPNDVSWYLGWFSVSNEDKPALQLFIELWPSGDSEEIGYPELLLDDRLMAGDNLKGYSYAKYRYNKRLTQSGDFRYNLTGDVFQSENSEYYAVYVDGMEHLVYRPDENNLFVLSSFSPKLIDLVFNFSYIFIFFLIVTSVCLLIFFLPLIKSGFQWNFRTKIQYSMIGIMLLSFAAISVFTFYYVNGQYLNKNIDILNEKIRAIHSELQEELLVWNNLEDLNATDKDLLSDWLSYFHRLFFTDVNLYDVRGQLIVSSLPDIFDKGLVGRQINPDAYLKLAFGQRTSFIENEDIGGLHYLSAYEIITDDENRVTAFLNLPYFTRQNTLTEEITNAITVLLNFYMVIILFTVILSVLMSNQITQPLMMLQEMFKNIKLGAKNDPVIYNSRDELGGLIKEYNRAIEELAVSAARLARSERETAWREMAKQIAHEINNPLTPMKLSVQHLKRAYDNKSERFDEYMEKISHSLVEQINSLSDIATEFSNFAKMPAPHNEHVDLIEQINNVVPLFAIDDNKRAFHADFHGLNQAMVYADKEQISRVFVNLFKNAVEAIPKEKEAKIKIDVLRISRIIWVRINDNGVGIPENRQKEIFRPNLSTKPSGMGLGLSIVHSIIESVGGSINFKSRTNEGTTFIISFMAID